MVNRIAELIQIKCNGVEKDFALKIGIKQQTINNYTNGKRTIKLDTINAILSTFEDVSAEWLLRGKGEMFITILSDGDKDVSPERLFSLESKISTLTEENSKLQAKLDYMEEYNIKIAARLNKAEEALQQYELPKKKNIS